MIVQITAPPELSVEVVDHPIEFSAETLAITSLLVVRLNGEVVSSVTDSVHILVLRIVPDDSEQ